jgi:tryptophanyl-tRNA synthetase
VLKEFGGAQFSTFKGALADLAVAKLAPIAEEMRRLTSDPGHIEAVLADGSARARSIAQPLWREVKKVVGFVGA